MECAEFGVQGILTQYLESNNAEVCGGAKNTMRLGQSSHAKELDTISPHSKVQKKIT